MVQSLLPQFHHICYKYQLLPHMLPALHLIGVSCPCYNLTSSCWQSIWQKPVTLHKLVVITCQCPIGASMTHLRAWVPISVNVLHSCTCDKMCILNQGKPPVPVQMRLQSTCQDQTRLQQPECPRPLYLARGGYCKFHSLQTYILMTSTQTLISTSIHIHIHAEFIFTLCLCSANLAEKRQSAPEG